MVIFFLIKLSSDTEVSTLRYIAGVAAMSFSEPDKDVASYYLTNAKEKMETIKKITEEENEVQTCFFL
jgi:hypothetical protein